MQPIEQGEAYTLISGKKFPVGGGEVHVVSPGGKEFVFLFQVFINTLLAWAHSFKL